MQSSSLSHVSVLLLLVLRQKYTTWLGFGALVQVLHRGIMAPFSAQNTLFLQDAFWGLLLPVTVSQRVSDIWRGYWAQVGTPPWRSARAFWIPVPCRACMLLV